MIDSKQWLSKQPSGLVPMHKWQRTVTLMADLFKAPAGFIVQYTPDGFEVTIASEQPENPYPAGSYIPPDANIFCRRIVETGKQLYVKQATTMPEWDTNPEVSTDGFNSYLGLPIQWPDGEPFGTICVMDFQVTDYEDTYIELIQQFRDMIQGDLMLVKQYERIQEQALTDELTGLLNRRGFMSIADQRINLARRYETPLAIIFLDMDGLKIVNDNLGHDQGDLAIKTLAKVLQDKMRNSDVIARLGGDEFIIMAESNAIYALDSACERIHLAFTSQMSEHGNDIVGLSYGITEITNLNSPLQEWINKADEAMYSNKRLKKSASTLD